MNPSIVHQFNTPPKRVASLVPSMTESLFELGFGAAVVGITDFCTQPADKVASLPRLGGPKNPRVDEIIALQPDLVLANWEENTRKTVEALEEAGVRVWVTFPKTVRQSLDVLWKLVELFRSPLAAARVESLEVSLEWAQKAAEQSEHVGEHFGEHFGEPVRYFCPIWQDATASGQPWWMTFNFDTYPHNLLAVLGCVNVCANRLRRYPLAADLGSSEPEDAGERDTRYPRLPLDEILQADPELILLPDEPYAYTEGHLDAIQQAFAGTSAARNRRIKLVDGSLLTWHGTRLARALQILPELLA